MLSFMLTIIDHIESIIKDLLDKIDSFAFKFSFNKFNRLSRVESSKFLS